MCQGETAALGSQTDIMSCDIMSCLIAMLAIGAMKQLGSDKRDACKVCNWGYEKLGKDKGDDRNARNYGYENLYETRETIAMLATGAIAMKG